MPVRVEAITLVSPTPSGATRLDSGERQRLGPSPPTPSRKPSPVPPRPFLRYFHRRNRVGSQGSGPHPNVWTGTPSSRTTTIEKTEMEVRVMTLTTVSDLRTGGPRVKGTGIFHPCLTLPHTLFPTHSYDPSHSPVVRSPRSRLNLPRLFCPSSRSFVWDHGARRVSTPYQNENPRHTLKWSCQRFSREVSGSVRPRSEGIPCSSVQHLRVGGVGRDKDLVSVHSTGLDGW